MPFRFHGWPAAVAGALLLAGCSSAPQRPASTGTAKPAKGVESPRIQPAPRGTPKPVEDAAEAHARYASGISLELNQESGKALEDFYKSALADPAHEALVLEVGRRLAQRREFEKAREILEKSSRRADATGLVFGQLAMVYAQMGRTNLALETGRTAVRRSPSYLPAYAALSRLQMGLQKPKEALAILDQAAKVPGVDARFLLDLADLYTGYGQRQTNATAAVQLQVRALLDRAADLKPQSPPLLQRLAEGYTKAGQAPKATAIYLDLLGRFDELPGFRDLIRTRLTELYLQGDDKEHALEQLAALVKDNPASPQAHFFLATVAAEAGKMAQAVAYFRKTIELKPDYEAAYYELAKVQMSDEQPREALTTLKTARLKFDQSFLGEYLAALACSRLKEYPESLKYLTSAERIGSADYPQGLTHYFYFQFGVCYERLKEYAQAEKYFRKSLQLEPEFAEALNYLGYTWADRGENLQEAREMIEKAVRLQPRNAAYLDSLGWVLFRLNQPREALRHIQTAVELTEEPDATLFDHLGDVLAALNQPEAAAEAWKKALSLGPNDAIRRKLEAHNQPHP